MSYCVNCGVELNPGARECPLCRTPVVNPSCPVDAAEPGFFPVHSEWGDVYADAEDADLRAPFALMSDYLGRYYALTGGWTEQRALWWPMLAAIMTTGADVQTAADDFVSQANANIG